MKHIPTYALGDNRLPERFWRKVTVDTGSGCWVWMGATTSSRYGSILWQGRAQSTHRIAYEVLTGETIPDGLTIDHVARLGCIHRACLNPAHLEVVTPAENNRRAWDVRGRAPVTRPKSWEQTFLFGDEAVTRRPFRSHCPRGHEFTEDNTYTNLLKSGAVSRQCKTCVKHRAKHGVYPDPVAPSEAMATPMARAPMD